ncbi:MAG: WD40/YVTN/BNR-like repeat-containing protein, partial [Acidimicrobiales bacterium]
MPDPKDPDTVYGAGLGGRLSKWDGKTGQVQNVSPWPVSTYGQRPKPGAFRYSWITPLAISARPPHAVYQASQVLWRSTDGGTTWQTISPDLTGAKPGSPRCDGDVALADATACGLGVIFAIAPSPSADGTVWVGTDNGRVHVTRDEGRTWADVTPPGMGDWTKVNIIDLSPTDPAVAYVAADRHRADDFHPFAFRTRDYGKTWTEIGHGLPDGGWVGVVRHDPKRPGLLYAGTSRGVHVSFDDGETWQSLQLNLPTTGINDMLVKNEDVVVATQGRGLWVLDAVTPLRHIDVGSLASKVVMTPPAVAYRIAANQNKDTPLPPDEPRTPNPPAGAILDYFLPATPKGPVTLEIADADGRVVRRIQSDDPPPALHAQAYFTEVWRTEPKALPARAGHNRFVWDLRLSRPRAAEYEYSIAGVPGQPTPLLPAGPFVVPGTYEVRVIVDGEIVRQMVTVAQDPRRHETPDDLRMLLGLQREAIAALEQSADAAAEKERIETRLEALDADPRARGAAQAIARVREGLDSLGGPGGALEPEKISGLLGSLETDLE